MKKYKDKDWMLTQYRDKQRSQREIAEMCDISQSTVSTWLDKLSIKKRSRSESNTIFSNGQPENWEMSEEAKNRLSELRTGQQNPNWKNGNWTDDSKDFRDTKKWERFSRKLKQERGWECENCGQYGGELHTHHANPVSDGGSKWDNTFIILCCDCHQGNYDFWHTSEVEEQLGKIAQ